MHKFDVPVQMIVPVEAFATLATSEDPGHRKIIRAGVVQTRRIFVRDWSAKN
jgi:hypothetical protein